jgi:hypothetical protein
MQKQGEVTERYSSQEPDGQFQSDLVQIILA